MSFLTKIFGPTESPIESYSDFWRWFVANEAKFHRVVQSKDVPRIEREFFAELAPKLRQVKEGIFFLVGMLDENMVDMIFTAEGSAKTIAFVEELVDAAPDIPGWVFQASKPPAEQFKIDMNGITIGRIRSRSIRMRIAICPILSISLLFIRPLTGQHQIRLRTQYICFSRTISASLI